MKSFYSDITHTMIYESDVDRDDAPACGPDVPSITVGLTFTDLRVRLLLDELERHGIAYWFERIPGPGFEIALQIDCDVPTPHRVRLYDHGTWEVEPLENR